MIANVAKRVEGYLKRAKNDTYAKNYPLEKEGLYELIGGTTGEYGDRKKIGYCQGRFVDVVAKLVVHPDYGGWYVGIDGCTTHRDHGYILEFKPKITHVPKIQELVEYLNQKQKLTKEKEKLETKITKLQQQIGENQYEK
jgi:hypothetical protein